MRFNDAVTLLSTPQRYQDETGAWHEGEPVQRTIFCNPMTIGVVAMANLRSSEVRMMNATQPVDVGLRNEHMLQIRALDYAEEQQCIYHGEQYEVLYASGSGEFRVLTIGQRLGSEPEGSGYGG